MIASFSHTALRTAWLAMLLLLGAAGFLWAEQAEKPVENKLSPDELEDLQERHPEVSQRLKKLDPWLWE